MICACFSYHIDQVWVEITFLIIFSSDGLYLAEVDRVLRPGGYWVLSGPPINWKKYYKGWERTREDLKQEQDTIEEAAKSLCWKKFIEKDNLAIWQKPINHLECIESRKTAEKLQLCNKDNADAAWYENYSHMHFISFS